MVGSESDYKSGTNSDIYYIIKESHPNWENVRREKLYLYKDRAIIKIIGDRTAEGVRSEDEFVEFQFIRENGSWKIDFYYPSNIEIIPVSPELEKAIAYEDNIEVEFEVISFSRSQA